MVLLASPGHCPCESSTKVLTDTPLWCLTTLWWTTWSTVTWRISLQIREILVQRKPHSFTLPHISSSPTVMGIWVPRGTVPHGELPKQRWNQAREPALTSSWQYWCNLQETQWRPWKEGRNQKAPCLQDRQPRSATGVGIMHRRKCGKRIRMGFVKTCSYLLLSSTHEGVGMLCYLTSSPTQSLF